LLKSWMSIETEDTLLVIAPRHPKRLGEIVSQLSVLTDKIAIRSKNESVNNDTKIYIIDTLGELTRFMPRAKFIFMGGSLVDVGGHNIFEPANMGKAIVFGRFMRNYSDAATLFINHDAAIMIKTNADISITFKHLLADAKRCELLGANAKYLVSQYRNIAENYVKELEPYIERSV